MVELRVILLVNVIPMRASFLAQSIKYLYFALVFAPLGPLPDIPSNHALTVCVCVRCYFWTHFYLVIGESGAMGEW